MEKCGEDTRLGILQGHPVEGCTHTQDGRGASAAWQRCQRMVLRFSGTDPHPAAAHKLLVSIPSTHACTLLFAALTITYTCIPLKSVHACTAKYA